MVSVHPAWRCTSPLGVARWVGRRRWRLSQRRQSSKGVSFYFPFVSFLVNRPYSFSKGMVFDFSLPLGMQVAQREPTPCYHDAYSVEQGILGERLAEAL